MGAPQSRAVGIQELRAAGHTYRFIASRAKCSFRAISETTNTPAIDRKKVGHPKKLIPKISKFIETQSCLDSNLTNTQIATMINQRWTSAHLSEKSVSAERIRFGFSWRPPLVKQDLSAAQEHQRLQFALKNLRLSFDVKPPS
jgi:hypothetical protein